MGNQKIRRRGGAASSGVELYTRTRWFIHVYQPPTSQNLPQTAFDLNQLLLVSPNGARLPGTSGVTAGNDPGTSRLLNVCSYAAIGERR